MANKIIPKRSTVAGKAPATGDLDIGEIAINLTDRKLYAKDGSGAVVQIGGGAGTGDVVGPNSATDNALTRFDGTTGKLVQNSNATLDDDGNLSLGGTGYFKFPVGTTAQRPSSPQTGWTRINTDRTTRPVMEFYDGAEWVIMGWN